MRRSARLQKIEKGNSGPSTKKQPISEAGRDAELDMLLTPDEDINEDEASDYEVEDLLDADYNISDEDDIDDNDKQQNEQKAGIDENEEVDIFADEHDAAKEVVERLAAKKRKAVENVGKEKSYKSKKDSEQNQAFEQIEDGIVDMLWSELDNTKKGFFTSENMKTIAENCGLTLAADVLTKMVDLAAGEDEAEIVTKEGFKDLLRQLGLGLSKHGMRC